MSDQTYTPETLRALADVLDEAMSNAGIGPVKTREAIAMRSYADAWQADRQMRQDNFLEVIRLDDVVQALVTQLEAVKAREEALQRQYDSLFARHHAMRRVGYVKHYAKSLEEAQELVRNVLMHDEELRVQFLAASEPPGEEGTP